MYYSGHRDGASLIELEPPGISSPVHPGQSEVGQEEPITKNCNELADQARSAGEPCTCREKFGARPIFKIFSLDQIRVDQEKKGG